MIRYKSIKQLSFEEFKTPFQIHLDKGNRWVKLGDSLPWDELAEIYYHGMDKTKGQPAVDARIAIGALIVKHKLKLDDRETIETIRENVYIQYFLGLSQYTAEDVFDRSLFTALRYRMGADKFDAMTLEIIHRSEAKPGPARQRTDKIEKQNSGQHTGSPPQQRTQHLPNKGKLQMDATVADQMIVFPTDLGLLAKSREESERLIDALCELLKEKQKPRTYRRKARQQYLELAKKKTKSKRALHKAIGQQIRYLKRNISSIEKLLDSKPGRFPLPFRDQQIYWVIQHIYAQQKEMYDNHIHSIKDRIVNIYQPYVRPIVRGKDKAKVEFGAKLGVSLCDGYARINTLSWDAYNESTDLKKQVESFYQAHGHYPEVVLTDTIYGTRENRQWLKEHGIRYAGKALGRPSCELKTAYQKRKYRKEQAMRNQIEGKFGQGKNGYNLNKIRARRARTSESWIASIFFVMNLVRFSKDFLFSSLLYLIKGISLCVQSIKSGLSSGFQKEKYHKPIVNRLNLIYLQF